MRCILRNKVAALYARRNKFAQLGQLCIDIQAATIALDKGERCRIAQRRFLVVIHLVLDFVQDRASVFTAPGGARIVEMEDGQGVLKLTVATYWRPSGKNIHRFKNAKSSDEWGVSPNPNMEVKLTDKETFDWMIGRRELDLVTFGKRKSKTDEGAKKEAEAKEKAQKEKTKFVDKQRDKAAEIVKQLGTVSKVQPNA